MNKEEKIDYFKSILKNFKKISKEEIEISLYNYVIKKIEKKDNFNENEKIFKDCDFPINIEYIIEFFEILIDENNKEENGIVFTPKYISDYIVQDIMYSNIKIDKDIKIIDPSCGCGIFIISAIEYLYKIHKFKIEDIIKNNIFGIDIMEDNIRRCKYVIKLYCYMNGIKEINEKMNLLSKNSLDCDWNKIFNIEKFDYAIGNPPYVNTHDMKKDTIKLLKENFITTQVGVFNIFYAFIEKSYKECSNVEFIVPNNFLTIKSAINLRMFIKEHKCLNKIIDFSENMVFKPVRTYNCIIKINNKNNENFKYNVMEKVEDIHHKLQLLEFNEMNINNLDDNGWKLVDKKTFENIKKIEGQMISIKDFIRTGIATLKDEVYLVNYDKEREVYFKNVDSKIYEIDKDLVKPIYKIPDLKNEVDENRVVRYIIFPYYKNNGTYKIIEENKMKEKYKNTYEYLLSKKDILDKRDKGKINSYGWYAYGRTQGLNKYGRKMLFPTFANKPKFKIIEDENALFCNGYGVFENDIYELEILNKILNSNLMQYYVKNTSYSIEGGYYCYQKKYIEKFSIPYFNDKELKYIENSSQERVNYLLCNKYNIDI